ncbi:uncharacterized protein LOC124541925 [Vanessa cardui]|uniref:uncharacterized protein LOC124541925 n=1 Tax=Vanessa cardui TaxID=171605 RepID=UPI001F12FBDB|nr:uncharacterized protein LOC124541925 [Vanessa cardui]XP_046975815.1 uncharacterized protein LOC124541925 [Vanessa cardui]
MPWQRPENVPMGKVWGRFQGRERNGVPGLMYQIRDMDDHYKQPCLDLMQETFLRDEPLCQVLDLKSDPESIETIRSNWTEMLNQKTSIACFTEENGEPKELVGFNILTIYCKDDEKEDFDKVKGEQWRKILKVLTQAENLVDVYSKYGVDTYLSSSGLTVLPGHRGQNIGARLIEAREALCKEYGIKAACTVFTAKTSQILAAKCGYEVLATLQYSEMLKEGIDLTGCSCSEAKVMGIKFK